MGSSKRRKLSATGALAAGFKEGMGVLPAWLGLSVVLGVGAGMLDHRIAAWMADDAHLGALKGLSDILLAVGGLGAVVFLMQLARRSSASRSSWWLPVLALPALLSGLLFRSLIANMGAAQTDAYAGLLLAAFAHMFLMLTLFGVIFTPLMAWVLLTGVERRRLGETGPALGGIGRLFDVMVPVGLRELLVSVGYQMLIVPGVWFDISYVFTPQLAVLHPEEDAFKVSSRVAKGIRSRIFRLNIVIGLGKILGSMGIAALFGSEAFKLYSAVAMMGTPQDLVKLPTALVYIVPVFQVFMTGWWLLAALQFFRPRMERLLARRADATGGAEGSA